MFDIGFGEMILLAAIALIAIGPKQLPEVARTLGRLLGEFKKVTGDFTRAVSEARDSTDEKLASTLADTQRALNESFYSNGTAGSVSTPKADQEPSPESTLPRPAPRPPTMPLAVATPGAVSPAPAESSVSSSSDVQEPSPPQIQPAPEARPLVAGAMSSLPLVDKKES